MPEAKLSLEIWDICILGPGDAGNVSEYKTCIGSAFDTAKCRSSSNPRQGCHYGKENLHAFMT